MYMPPEERAKLGRGMLAILAVAVVCAAVHLPVCLAAVVAVHDEAQFRAALLDETTEYVHVMEPDRHISSVEKGCRTGCHAICDRLPGTLPSARWRAERAM